MENIKNIDIYNSRMEKSMLDKMYGIKWSEEQKGNLKIIRNKIKPNNTLWWKLISPENKEFVVWGLGSFCRENGLSQSHLCNVANGKRKFYKGWKCFKIIS